MAKVTEPSDTLALYRTVGRAFTCRYRKLKNFVSKTFVVAKRTDDSQTLVENTAQAYIDEYRTLSPSEKQALNELAEESFTTGFDLWMKESFRSSLQSVCGYARCGQNVCVAGD